jgi:hypothetical protein
LHELYHNFNSFKECADVDDGLQKVLCHNNLCAENVQFNRQDELIGILNWEHASFGHVGLDLTYLMISSMSPSERRQNYLKVLRHYYYRLVNFTFYLPLNSLINDRRIVHAFFYTITSNFALPYKHHIKARKP